MPFEGLHELKALGRRRLKVQVHEGVDGVRFRQRRVDALERFRRQGCRLFVGQDTRSWLLDRSGHNVHEDNVL